MPARSPDPAQARPESSGSLSRVLTRLGRVSGTALAVMVSLSLAACGSSATTPSPSPSASASVSAVASPDASASPSASTTPKPSITASSTTDAITVTGEFGKAPTITVPAPWAIDKSQARVLIPGTGTEITDTSLIEINYHGVDGRTGKVFDESFTSGQTVSFALSGVIPGFATTLKGQKVGSRVLLAITGPDGYDPNGGAPDVGIEVGDTLVFVVDIVSASLRGPSGAAVTPAAGLPTVSDDIKKPVITVDTKATPPAALVVQPLITGTGRKVAETDGLQVDYAEVAWSTGKVVKQTYGYQPVTGALATSLPGWKEALVGQTVGSRVLIVVPPSKAYPAGNRKIGVKEGETMVYVVDILFAQAGA